MISSADKISDQNPDSLSRAIFSLLVALVLASFASQPASAEQAEPAHNPLIWADVPDIAIIRVGKTYYMSSTTMHMNPGLPIMTSTDLVNWSMASYAYQTHADNEALRLENGKDAYSKGSWASSLRFHDGVVYASTFSYTSGRTHIYSTRDPERGPWKETSFEPALHDHSLFFDDDGRVFMVYGGGRITLTELKPDLSGIKPGGVNKVLIENVNTIFGTDLGGLNGEGSQLFKVDGRYYLFNIASPGSRWARTVIIHRADKIDGPYEGRIVLDDRGIAQGGLIDTPDGKWYAYLFKDNGAVGRIPYLVPVTWKDGWPVLGEDGKAPMTLDIPAGEQGVSGVSGIVASDEFNRKPGDPALPLAWQWNHNPDNDHWSITARPGFLRLTTARVDSDVERARNTLTQRTFGPTCSATTCVDVSHLKPGDTAGLIALMGDYGYIGVKATDTGRAIVMTRAEKRMPVEVASVPLTQDTVHFKIDCDFADGHDKAYFYYSLDGHQWNPIGEAVQLRYTGDHFMGCRFGLFNFATQTDGGYADFDYYRIGHSITTSQAQTTMLKLPPITDGPFKPDWNSLTNYNEAPEWFRDAKFGIWAHWGPQCEPEHGDWYARGMYEEGGWQNKLHIAEYGHPSTHGFKDVIRVWKAERFDPDTLVKFYKDNGAKIFMALANHHDNFDLYDSKYQPWNSVALGPKKDLIGGWAKAARKHGLRFGVSVHASHAWMWYEPAQGADKSGPLAGVPYDGKLTKADGKGQWWEGLDPQELYEQNHTPGGYHWEWDATKGSSVPNAAYMEKFFKRTLQLWDDYKPDQIYFDDTVLPFHGVTDEVGLKLAAHFYNTRLDKTGRTEAVMNGKWLSETQRRALVYDIERGKAHDILPQPWQTDTCIGSWHYDHGIYERKHYKSAASVVQMLADIVSKNGNLMLSVPLRRDGQPDEEEIKIVSEIGAWLKVNGEAIYATRPWKIYGEGPATQAAEKGQFDGQKDVSDKPFTAADIRFTQSKDGKTLYAIVLELPQDGKVTVKSLAANSGQWPGKIGSVQLVGGGNLKFARDADGLHVSLPEKFNGKIACALKVR